MRESLRTWIADADTRSSVDAFALRQAVPALAYQDGRLLDLYSSLVGEVFDLLRSPADLDPRDWPTLGRGLSLVAAQLEGRTRADALFYAASSYYLGGLSSAAYLTMRRANPNFWDVDSFRACYDLLARPQHARSQRIAEVIRAVAGGESDRIRAAHAATESEVAEALETGPDTWISTRILASLLERFESTNVRAVLPQGDAMRWTPLVESLLDRHPPVWDFFPSQVEAIQAGLLGSEQTFSMQMPTGAGKTALTETLIFDHLTNRPEDVAALLVPYRSLARELRVSMGRRLTNVGITTRAVYGGTVPTPEESQDIDSIRLLIATPESMVGLLGNVPEVGRNLSLIVCDEGHLLDSGSRGVSLELLLSRFLARVDSIPRMVFVSAVVPNIEEVNSWLGGDNGTVVRSAFRPADAEYAVLRDNRRTGRLRRLTLEIRAPAGTNLPSHSVPNFLQATDFEYVSAATGKRRTYTYDSYKPLAIAAARKALPLGTVAVFTRPKRGAQGVVALAKELIDQVDLPMPMPSPADYIEDADYVDTVGAYLAYEYGADWVGTKALAAGAVLHHGDVPQETREALEEMLVAGNIRMVLCTSTLAEGVNLPIRTLVVYTTHLQVEDGVIPMLAREIRNLVGRAGRAGSSTRGLVLCVNDRQWDAMVGVADGAPGEPVEGALLKTVERLTTTLLKQQTRLTNGRLEGDAGLFSMVDGIDATLLELLSEEIGRDEFVRLAESLSASTYAYRRAEQQPRATLENVFRLRAERLIEMRDSGRLAWVRSTGVRIRIVDSVADHLLGSFDRWHTVDDPADPQMLTALLSWAWQHGDFTAALRDAYPKKELLPPENLPPLSDLLEQVRMWLEGDTFARMKERTGQDVDRLLRIHTGAISYALVTLVEQAVVVLEQLSSAPDQPLSPVVTRLPDFIRFGVNTMPARDLMADGVRHRRAAVLLGRDPAMTAPENLLSAASEVAHSLLEAGPDRWGRKLGTFVFHRTQHDLGVVSPQTE